MHARMYMHARMHTRMHLWSAAHAAGCVQRRLFCVWVCRRDGEGACIHEGTGKVWCWACL